MGTCKGGNEVRLIPSRLQVSGDLPEHGLPGVVFLRHEAESSSAPHVSHIRSDFADCRHGAAKILGRFITALHRYCLGSSRRGTDTGSVRHGATKILGRFVGRYGNDDAAVVHLLQMVGQLDGCVRAQMGVELENWLHE